MKVAIINGSPRPDTISNTFRALEAEKAFFRKRAQENNQEISFDYLKIPQDFSGCVGCAKCEPYCRLTNNAVFLRKAIELIRDATDVILGSPVYLDMPTPQVVAFLTRLNSMVETSTWEFTKDKNMWLVSVSFCSGTKTCVHSLMGTTEMLGFNLPGRGSREYIAKWDDRKLRGGRGPTDAVFLD